MEEASHLAFFWPLERGWGNLLGESGSVHQQGELSLCQPRCLRLACTAHLKELQEGASGR